MGSKRNAFFLRPFATAIGTCVLLHQFGTEQSLGAKKKKKKTIKRLPIGRWTGILQVSTVIVCFSFLQEDDEQTLECGDADAANAQNTCTQIIRVMVPSVKGS